MTLSDMFSKNEETSPTSKKTFKILRNVVSIAGFVIAAQLLFPKVVSTILSIIWIILIVIASIFFILGILVVVGLRKETKYILDIVLEGTLTFLDLIDFLKLVYKRFIEILKEFLLYVAPAIAYTICLIVYVLLMMLYKYVGKSHDILIFTIIFTFLLVLFVGIINKPKALLEIPSTFKANFISIYKASFIDGFEVMLFIFFLTMDSTNLVFLPEHMNVPLHADFKDYNFMVKAFRFNDHFKYTLNIIVAAISIEILRYALRIVAQARRHYLGGQENTRSARIKSAMRASFSDAKDDVIKFITFTTVVFAVFLLFPRLKLITLVTASFTNLLLDIFIAERLVITKGTDLINRIIIKAFKL